MAIKFYMTPGSCSTGIHILLEECELVFEVHLVNLLAGDHQQTSYLAINPKGTIPTLVTYSGQALTDFQSIAWWLAKKYPRYQLLPESIEQQMDVMEMMNYVVQTIHGEGFARIFTSEKFIFTSDDEQQTQDKVIEQGRAIVEKGLSLIDQRLKQKADFKETFSIADAALFYVEFWADRIQIPLPKYCLAHYQHLLQRPSVRQVLAEEGYASVLV